MNTDDLDVEIIAPEFMPKQMKPPIEVSVMHYKQLEKTDPDRGDTRPRL